jgi:hypothetical protein
MDAFLRQPIEDLTTLADADDALLSVTAGLPGANPVLPAVEVPVAPPAGGGAPIATPPVAVGAPGGAPAAIPSLALNR